VSAAPRILTVGHSNRPLAEFTALLRTYRIGLVVDVRRHPSSRRHPWFNGPRLASALAAEGIRYEWLEDLGGHRQPLPEAESPNTGLGDPALRGYADHMLRETFRAAAAALLQLAATARTAVMCAESEPDRCHRRLLCDLLTAWGVSVAHVLGPGEVRPHAPSAGAVVTPDQRLIYPGQGSLGF
jgi:uncharacterized protein (DUF488 family)